MKYLILFVMILIYSVEPLSAQPNIYIVRHSEKINNWQNDLGSFQALSIEGIETSKKLSNYFLDKNLTAIYSSKTARTIHTAYYTSQSKKIDIIIEDACSDTSKIDSFLKSLKTKYTKDQSILIVSHSNIIPYFLIKAGLKKEDFKNFEFTKSNKWWVTDYYGFVYKIELQNGNISKEKFVE